MLHNIMYSVHGDRNTSFSLLRIKKHLNVLGAQIKLIFFIIFHFGCCQMKAN